MSEQKPSHAIQDVGQKQILMDRHPGTVELSENKMKTMVHGEDFDSYPL